METKEEENTIIKLNPKIKLKYPFHKEKELQSKIALKKEFQHFFDGELKNYEEETSKEDFCKFTELAPHQKFIKNFINYDTPYNGVLLYHGMGSGKTCSAMGITEEFRRNNKYNNDFKKIIIIASPNVQQNFKLQLFDDSKLYKKNKLWYLDGCVGSGLLQEIKDYDIENMEKEEIVKLINNIIRKNYLFVGYEKFANKIKSIINVNSNSERAKSYIQKKLKEEFQNSMIVIDEAHNLRSIGDNSFKHASDMIQKLVKHVKKTKLILLSGTPMYNNPREIVFLLNLLNENDNHKPIKESKIFNKENELIVKDGEEIGKNNLIKLANGYISYVRGDNPYTFPFKIFPFDYNSSHSLKNIEYPVKQFNNKQIETSIQYLDLFVTNLSEKQEDGYLYFIEKIKQKIIGNGEENKEEKYENMDSFGYTLLQEPIHALNICYKTENDNGNISYKTGKDGLNTIVRYNNETSRFEYHDNDNRIFKLDKIKNYSAKIFNILNIIKESTGIILIYSQFLDSGLIPIALALEEMGFKRSNHNNLFGSGLNVENPFKLKDNEGNRTIFPKYSMITGNVKYSPNNLQELKNINHENNLYGNKCKVVLISQAGSEGLDFKNLRQVHILEPWYNLNRIEQIIGRAARNCSHKLLPKEERNTQVFLHGSLLKSESDKEAIDLMIYRYAEKKSVKIGNVQKLLKSISVDCLLNHSQTNFKNFRQELSHNLSSKKDYVIKKDKGDRQYSYICDFSEDCDYKCYNDINISEQNTDNSTYKYKHSLETILIQKIKNLFLKRHFYKEREIISEFRNKTYTTDNILTALMYIIENNNELIIDKYNVKGRLINKNDLYLFQPIKLSNNVYTYDRKVPLKHKPKELLIDYTNTNNDPYVNTNIKNNEINKNSNSKNKIQNNSLSTNQINTVFSIGQKSHMQHVKLHKTFLSDVGFSGKNLDFKYLKDNDYYNLFKITIDLIIKYLKDTHLDMIKILSNNEVINSLFIEFMLERLNIKTKISLFNYLNLNSETNVVYEYSMIKYFNKFKQNITGNDGDQYELIFLVNLNEEKDENIIQKRIHILYLNKNNGSWNKLDVITKDAIGINNIINALKKYEIKQLPQYIGFVDYFDKNKDFDFKVKNTELKNKNNKGAFFINKTPNDMKKIIITLLNENNDIKINEKQHVLFKNKDENGKKILNKHQYNLMGEIIMKIKNIQEEEKQTGKKYYLNQLEQCFA